MNIGYAIPVSFHHQEHFHSIKPIRSLSQYRSKSMLRFYCASAVFLIGMNPAQCLDGDQFHIDMQADGRIIVPTNQVLKPAGEQITFPGRPVDLLAVDQDKTLLVKNDESLIVIDLATRQ